MSEKATCEELVFDSASASENMAIWNTYGSELAGNFGNKFCGKPVVWAERCTEHAPERRKVGTDRRKANNAS